MSTFLHEVLVIDANHKAIRIRGANLFIWLVFRHGDGPASTVFARSAATKLALSMVSDHREKDCFAEPVPSEAWGSTPLATTLAHPPVPS
jgi:hypothetical protein